MRTSTAKPIIVNGHRLEVVEAGEEWDAENECTCRLKKAVCKSCRKEGTPARSEKGAVKKFERRHGYTFCTAASPAGKARP